MNTYVGMFEDAKLKDQLKKLKKKLREAEGELSIIKAIGNNSPEMKDLKKRVKDLMAINKEHQMINGKLNSTLSIEQKNSTLLREEIQAKDLELGRMMDKLSRKSR